MYSKWPAALDGRAVAERVLGGLLAFHRLVTFISPRTCRANSESACVLHFTTRRVAAVKGCQVTDEEPRASTLANLRSRFLNVLCELKEGVKLQNLCAARQVLPFKIRQG